MEFKKEVEVKMFFSLKEAAAAFCDAGSEAQGEFFNEIARLSEMWEEPFSAQALAICESDSLTYRGRSIIQALASFLATADGGVK